MYKIVSMITLRVVVVFMSGMNYGFLFFVSVEVVGVKWDFFEYWFYGDKFVFKGFL